MNPASSPPLAVTVKIPLEYWDDCDVRHNGRVVKSKPFSPHSIDLEKSLLIEGGEGDGVPLLVVPVARARKRPTKSEFPSFVERRTIVEVWTEDGTRGCAWFLGMVEGFYDRKIFVNYFEDNEVELVSRNICRLAYENGKFEDAEQVAREYPEVKRVDETFWKDVHQLPDLPKPKKHVTPSRIFSLPNARKTKPSPRKSLFKPEAFGNNNNNNYALMPPCMDASEEVNKCYEEYCRERDSLYLHLTSLRMERAEREEDKAKAAKMLHEMTNECQHLFNAETKVESARYQLEALHEQMLCQLIAKRREMSGGKRDLCANCQREIDVASEETMAVFQCHMGHPMCCNCRQMRHPFAACTRCHQPPILRYTTKAYLKPMDMPNVYVVQPNLQQQQQPLVYLPQAPQQGLFPMMNHCPLEQLLDQQQQQPHFPPPLMHLPQQ